MTKNQGIPAEERFWMNVDKKGEDECWEWLASGHRFGHGYFSIRRKKVAAHRYSYELAYGAIASGLCVCHHCDNPKCVNPKHLFSGTQQDNLKDMVDKGRARGGSNKGEIHGRAKLTSNQVVEIKRMLDNGVKGVIIARQFNVHKHTIYAIKAGVNWKHLE